MGTRGIVLALTLALALCLTGCNGREIVGTGGGDNIEIPDMTGMTIPEAVKALGIRVDITLEESSEASAGTIIAQSHAPGTRTDHDDIVRLTVAGPLTVPDIVGMNKSDAWVKLGNEGFDSDYTFDPGSTEPSGTVLSQEPPPGTKVMDRIVSFTIAGADPWK